MYCRYDYNAGATAANVMSDIIAILTGTTSTAGLSASCNKGTSVIISTVAAGWTVHDAAAGSGAQVLKAPFADASGYKYAWINFTATTYGNGLYESWNAGTHTGTNAAYTSNPTQTSGYSLAAGGTIFIFAAATYIHLLCFTGSTYGMFISIMERTRSSLWDTAAVGVPPVIMGNNGNNGALNYSVSTGLCAPRTKGLAFTDVTSSSASYSSTSLWGQVSVSAGTPAYVAVAASKAPDTTGTLQFVTTDLYVLASTRGDMGGQLYGIKHVSTGGNTSDDVTVGGQTWFYVATAQGGTSAPCVCFPKF